MSRAGREHPVQRKPLRARAPRGAQLKGRLELLCDEGMGSLLTPSPPKATADKPARKLTQDAGGDDVVGEGLIERREDLRTRADRPARSPAGVGHPRDRRRLQGLLIEALHETDGGF